MVDITNPLDMSDEDISNMTAPPTASPVVEEVKPDPVAEIVPETPDANAVEGVEGKEAGDSEDGTKGQEAPEGNTPESKTEEKQEEKTPEDKDADGNILPLGSGEAKKPEDTEKKPEAKDPAGDGKPVADTTVPAPIDHKSFYEKVMAPFKANGKTIELKTPEEAIQLIQMGANYTRKMQAIAPHRKMLTMMENNGIDEGKLDYLISLDKKEPEAIKKLIKDSGIDPLEIDTSVDADYRAGNHTVTDEEVSFQTTLDELGSSPEGKETLTTINSWDQDSKGLLFTNPDIMPVIHAQREIGIYDRITAEMDRRKVLGSIKPNVPFLEAYRIIGDELAEAGSFDDIIAKSKTAPVAEVKPDPKPELTPVAVRAATPKADVDNDDKANAASPNRSSSKPAKTNVNPLAQSDDQFMADYEKFIGRV